jgi:hypothetical protein
MAGLLTVLCVHASGSQQPSKKEPIWATGVVGDKFGAVRDGDVTKYVATTDWLQLLQAVMGLDKLLGEMPKALHAFWCNRAEERSILALRAQKDSLVRVQHELAQYGADKSILINDLSAFLRNRRPEQWRAIRENVPHVRARADTLLQMMRNVPGLYGAGTLTAEPSARAQKSAARRKTALERLRLDVDHPERGLESLQDLRDALQESQIIDRDLRLAIARLLDRPTEPKAVCSKPQP